jgi:hypothetical protein
MACGPLPRKCRRALDHQLALPAADLRLIFAERSGHYGRTRDARNIGSAARGRAFSGQARAATSSFISSDHLDWYSDVALELWAMAAPTEGAPRKVTEMEPVAVFRPGWARRKERQFVASQLSSLGRAPAVTQ